MMGSGEGEQVKSGENSACLAYPRKLNGQTLYDVDTFALTLPDKNNIYLKRLDR